MADAPRPNDSSYRAPSATADDPLSDHSLLRRLREGEPDAATRLYLRYAARLQAVARAQTSPMLASRFDPEDVVQSVFRTFFRRAQEGLYDVPPGEQLWQLLLVLALNKVRALGAYHRAQKRDAGRTRGMPSPQMLAGTRDDVAQRALTLVIEEVIEQLSPLQQRMIELRIAGHEVADIAAKTSRSKRTVERVLQKFRQQLSDLVDQHEPNADAP